METITLRPLRSDDHELCAALFFDAIHYGTTEYYSGKQRRAWAGPMPDPENWKTLLAKVSGFVASHNDQPAGFMTVNHEGYIDFAFVKAAAQGIGLGLKLYQAIENHARTTTIPRLETEASSKAKPFFERQGWHVEYEQIVVRNNVSLPNFKMFKKLQS